MNPPKAALVLLVLSVFGCDTRVIELAASQDAARLISGNCQPFVRQDGASCRLCFSETGMVTETTCGPPPTPPPVAPAANVPACKVTVEGDDRCILCPSPIMGREAQPACLGCDMRAPSGAGGSCRVCVWSDDPNRRCVQCYGNDGIKREDTCDGIRGEMLIYPTQQPDAGSGS
jgi:hypothetical protein